MERTNSASSNNLPVSSLGSELDDPDDVVVHFLYFFVLPNGRLNVLQNLHASQVIYQAGDVAVGDSSNPSHPPHPVDVVSGVHREVVVDNVTAVKPLLKI